MIDSVKSMIFYLKEELNSFNREDVINYLLLPVFGSSEFEPPFTVTEYLIHLYQPSGDLLKVFSKIHYSQSLTYPFSSVSDISVFEQIEEAIEKLSEPIMKKQCPRCGYYMQYPKVAKRSHVEAFEELIEIANEYLNENGVPEKILSELMKKINARLN